jgi:thiaminase/transcriptional activator TenA
MKFSEILCKEAQPILEAQYKHPFVKSLADGTLDIDIFRFYMIQDTLYIVEYARTIALAATLMPDVNEVINMLDTAKETFKIEAMLKEEYFDRLNISMHEALQAELSPTCKSYVDHLIRYTRHGNLSEAMAAILPCGWVYVEIGRVFTEGQTIDENHPYKSWLDTYAVPELRDMVNWWFDILDRAVDGLPEHMTDHVKDVFLKSCRYEWMFWDMAWKKEKWQPY